MNWMLSANGAVYNHYESFMKNGYIDWHQTANYKVGDIVYIYCTRPIQMIRYKTVVVAVGLKFNEITDDREFWNDITQYEKSKAGCYCRLVLVDEIYNEFLSLPFLLQNGLAAAPQGPIKISQELNEYLLSKCNENENLLLISSCEEFKEGRKMLKQHIVRERNPVLVKNAKQKFRQEHNGKLYCEVCGFDFSKFYGEIGENYIEIHHKKPVSTMTEGETTKLSDVAVVCSNCHRMIHRKQPWLTVEQLMETLSDK